MINHVNIRFLLSISFLFALFVQCFAQPEIPIEEWQDRTILLIGAHPDDDMYSHGTLAMLQENGNEIYILILTTGNVGTQDLSLSPVRLAQIRHEEELAALKVLGIPSSHYINFGYDDGLLEYEDKKAVVARLVREIRRIRPDVIFAFDPGKGGQRWHKADHRAACYLAADAARAAEWPLLFQGQIVVEGLKPFSCGEYMFFDSDPADVNMWVDISKYKEKKINAIMKYVSQFSSGWEKYEGSKLSAEEEKKVRAKITDTRIIMKQGKAVEGFRYVKGNPNDLGR